MLITSSWAEATRTREALEQFDLESLKFWHMYQDKCGVYAVILDSKGYAYHVRRGMYVGRNFGVVTKISKDRIHLREVYQKPDETWEEKDAFLKRWVSSRGQP
jgi:type IV pilus assembly protein PilP